MIIGISRARMIRCLAIHLLLLLMMDWLQSWMIDVVLTLKERAIASLLLWSIDAYSFIIKHLMSHFLIGIRNWNLCNNFVILGRLILILMLGSCFISWFWLSADVFRILSYRWFILYLLSFIWVVTVPTRKRTWSITLNFWWVIQWNIKFLLDINTTYL